MNPRCTYDRLAEAIAYFDGAVLDGPLEACHNPVTHTATVERGARQDGSGLAVELHADLCAGHDLLVSTAGGYLRSIKHRDRSPT